MYTEQMKKEAAVSRRDIEISAERQLEQYAFSEEPRPNMAIKNAIDISAFVASGGKIQHL